jgi:hypothetical protein
MITTLGLCVKWPLVYLFYCPQLKPGIHIPSQGHNIIQIITMFCGTGGILWNISHIQTECEGYSVECVSSQNIVMDLNNVIGGRQTHLNFVCGRGNEEAMSREDFGHSLSRS